MTGVGGGCTRRYPQHQSKVSDIVCWPNRCKFLSLRKGFQFVNLAKFDRGGSVWILRLRKISAGRDGRERYEAGRLHISTEILTCVLFLRECIISHAHQAPFHTIFGFHFWVRSIKVNWGFGLRLGSFLSSSDSVDCLCCFLLQPALQALANLLTQETGPPGRLSVIKFYLLSLCNFPSFFLSLSLFFEFGCCF